MLWGKHLSQLMMIFSRQTLHSVKMFEKILQEKKIGKEKRKKNKQKLKNQQK